MQMLLFLTSRVATGNNEHMVGLNVAPTFNANGYTGTRGSAIMTSGAIVPNTDNTIGLGAFDLHWSTIRSRKLESLTGDLTISTGSSFLTKFYNSSVQIGQISLAGNWIFQNGGTFSDNGDRVQISGNLNLITAGNKIKIATGVNASCGFSTLVGAQ